MVSKIIRKQAKDRLEAVRLDLMGDSAKVGVSSNQELSKSIVDLVEIFLMVLEA